MTPIPVYNSMRQPCDYCAGMQAALPDSNFCSHLIKESSKIESNAYYFSGSNITSGAHISRFSIRTVLRGYQNYKIDAKNYELGSDNFIMVQGGQTFENAMFPNTPVEGVVIALSQAFVSDYIAVKEHSHEYLLYSDDSVPKKSFKLSEHTFSKTPVLDRLFYQLAEEIQNKGNSRLFYFELFTLILDEIVNINNLVNHFIDNIQSQKSSTKEDLYHRLSATKDYIDAHISESLSTTILARIACMSPFHFLRSFNQLFQVTPHQYVLTQRLKKAEYLLKHLPEPIESIMEHTGFENNRTFQRAFAKAFGMTPLSYQKQYGKYL